MKEFKDILNIVEELGEDQFQMFKFFLNHEGIAWSYLEQATQCETVRLMLEKFEISGALQKTNILLEKIHRNDLIKTRSSGPEGQ